MLLCCGSAVPSAAATLRSLPQLAVILNFFHTFHKNLNIQSFTLQVTRQSRDERVQSLLFSRARCAMLGFESMDHSHPTTVRCVR